MSKNRVVVSFKKLNDFLINKNFLVVSQYVCNDSIRFIEAVTSKFQRHFMIYVSKKYKMVPLSTTDISCIKIYETREDADRQLQYIKNIKGDLIEDAIASISSRFVCLHKGDIFEKYNTTSKEDEDEENEEDITETDKIIKEASDILDAVSDMSQSSESSDQEEEEELDGEKVELEFEDEEGQSINDISDIIEKENVFKDTKVETKESSLSQEDIDLGIIYYTIDLVDLYKNIDGMEQNFSRVYEAIEDGISSCREDKILSIEKTCESIINKVRDSHDLFNTKESELKMQLSKLVNIFDQTTHLTNKIKQQGKYTDAKLDIDKVYRQTKTTIKELNMELLRLRDSFDNFIEEIYMFMKEVDSLDYS